MVVTVRRKLWLPDHVIAPTLDGPFPSHKVVVFAHCELIHCYWIFSLTAHGLFQLDRPIDPSSTPASLAYSFLIPSNKKSFVVNLVTDCGCFYRVQFSTLSVSANKSEPCAESTTRWPNLPHVPCHSYTINPLSWQRTGSALLDSDPIHGGESPGFILGGCTRHFQLAPNHFRDLVLR